MRRREFITLLGGAAAWPLAARAAGPRPRIAALSINSEQDERKNIAAFVDGLRALGYITSQNVDIDYRYAEGDGSVTGMASTVERGIGKSHIRFEGDPSRRACRSFARRSAISSFRTSLVQRGLASLPPNCSNWRVRNRVER
jgi:hypothetical protein